MSANPKDIISSFIPGQRGRKPANLPVIYNANGEVVPRYLTEKMLGMRRMNGAMKLQRLTHRHLKIIGMHLEGHSLEMIAMNMPCSINTVSRVLNDPLSQVILKRTYEDRKGEVQALGGKAIAAVREGLDERHPVGTRLRAVDRFAKIRQTMLGEDAGEDSAEDVIARMLSRMNVAGDVNIQVNVDGKKEG